MPARHRDSARLARRLGSGLLTLLATLLLCFSLAQLTPGDAYTALELDPGVPPATLAHLRAEYLPQQPLAQRWIAWLSSAARGDLGFSLQFHRPVLDLLRERAPASLQLIVLGLGMAWSTGLVLALIPAWLGEMARVRWQRALRAILHGLAALLSALPLGVLAVGALILAPAPWLPAVGSASPWLPAAILALAFLPAVYFQCAHALEEVLQRPFLMHGRASGLKPGRLLLRHALPNAADVLIPVGSLTVSQALVELVIVEPLLGWPGLGDLSLQAARSKDMPVLAALVLISSLLVIGCNWVSEALQIWWNPHLRAAQGIEPPPPFSGEAASAEIGR